jgi:hypothetical protein
MGYSVGGHICQHHGVLYLDSGKVTSIRKVIRTTPIAPMEMPIIRPY